MIKFAQVFPDPDILQALCAKLSWSHFKDLIYIQDPLKREFYAEMCRHESWSVRTLRKKIDTIAITKGDFIWTTLKFWIFLRLVG